MSAVVPVVPHPQPGRADRSDRTHRASGRRMFLLLVVALALPFILATALLFAGWQPAAARHYGELLSPGTLLALDDLEVLDGPQKSTLAGRWLLVSYEPAACAVACQQRLDVLRRVHVSLYKAMPRVKRVLLTPAAPAVAINQPDLTLAAASSWPALAAPRPAVWLVDPRGHAVLRYDMDDFSPAGLLKDAERLLRYSWTG